MNALVACPRCRRHVRVDHERCPFCSAQVELGSGRTGRSERALLTIGLAATASVGLAACYGAPGRYYQHGSPSEREQRAFRVYEQSGPVLEQVAAAVPSHCEHQRDGETLHVVCNGVHVELFGGGDFVEVQCRIGEPAECRHLYEFLRSEPAAAPADRGASPDEPTTPGDAKPTAPSGGDGTSPGTAM